jgi:hypothetical protein
MAWLAECFLLDLYQVGTGTIRDELACEGREKHFVVKDNDANSVLNGIIIMYHALVLHLKFP